MLSQRPDCAEGSLPWSPGRVRTFSPFCLLVSLELSCDSTLHRNELKELALSYEAVRFNHSRGGRGGEGGQESDEDVAATY